MDTFEAIAKRLIDAAVADCTQRSLACTVAVVDLASKVEITFMKGSIAPGTVAIERAKAAIRMRQDTEVAGSMAVRFPGEPPNSFIGGGVLLVTEEGELLGAMCIAGATSLENHEIARHAVETEGLGYMLIT